MIINIQRQSLVEPLKNIVNVSEQNQTMPILGHVLLEFREGVCFLTASDLEVQVSYSYEAGVTEDVRVTVPARKFSDILRSLETEDVTFEVTPKDIVIKSKTISGYDAPLIPGWDCHGLPIELMVEKNMVKKNLETIKMLLEKHAENLLQNKLISKK